MLEVRKKKHPTRVVFHFSWLQKIWFGILDFYGARDYSKFISTVGKYHPCRTPQTGSHIKSAPDFRTRRYPSYAVDIDCMQNRFPDVASPCPMDSFGLVDCCQYNASDPVIGSRVPTAQPTVFGVIHSNTCILAVKITLRDVNSWRSVWPDASVTGYLRLSDWQPRDMVQWRSCMYETMLITNNWLSNNKPC